MKRRLLCIAVLASLVGGCEGTLSHRSPAFSSERAPTPTLLTEAVPCLDKPVVAAGGQLVRRATAFGEEVTLALNMRVAREGDTAPSFPSSLCSELSSPNALDPGDWLSPKAPPILMELAAMAGAETVFVPVVTSTMACGRKPGPWRWGKPAYEDARGDLDCVETQVTLIGYLFDAQGSVLWKAIHEHPIDEPPEAAALANELLRDAPLGQAAPLTRSPTP